MNSTMYSYSFTHLPIVQKNVNTFNCISLPLTNQDEQGDNITQQEKLMQLHRNDDEITTKVKLMQCTAVCHWGNRNS